MNVPRRMESGARSHTHARALIAIGALLGFGALIVVVLVAGSGEDPKREFAEAPAECVDRWNESPDAVSTGVHNALSHGYSRVQVAYSSEDGSEISASPVQGGGCVVVFAAPQLDPEPLAAAEIDLEGSWRPLSTVAETSRLGELQGEAQAAANAELSTDGRMSPL